MYEHAERCSSSQSASCTFEQSYASGDMQRYVVQLYTHECDSGYYVCMEQGDRSWYNACRTHLGQRQP